MVVIAQTTIHFHMENIEYSVLSETYDHSGDWIRFVIPPLDYADCGTAIGGLRDELPFKELKIYQKRDSIVATSSTEVLSLFEKNLMGGFKTPYSIEVE